jgi:hypothetical protein
MAHTIADYLLMIQPRDSGYAIQLFAEDETYCASCVNCLCNTLRGKDDTAAESVGFQIVEDYTSFTADLLNEHTLFVAFSPRGSALVPVMNLTAPGGPAGLLCNLVLDNGEDELRRLQEGGTRGPLVDRSPALLDWATKCDDNVNTRDMDLWSLKREFRELVGMSGSNTFDPALYCAAAEEASGRSYAR